MKNILTLYITFGFFLTTNKLNAQCPTCDKALEQDSREYYTKELKSDFKNLLTEIFKHDYSYYEDGQWQQDKNFQSGGSYGIISGFLNGDESSEEKETRFNRMKDEFSRTQNIESSDYQLLSQSYTSQVVYKSWVECIKTCPNYDGPILEPTIIGKDVIVVFYWQHNNTNDKQTITDIDFGTNLTPVKGGTLFKTKTVIGRNSYSKKFKISDIHKSSYIIVTMSDYPAAKIIIPSVPDKNKAIIETVQIQYNFISFEDEMVGTKLIYMVNPGCSNCGCNGRPCYGGNGATVASAMIEADPNNYYKNGRFVSDHLNPFVKVFEPEYWYGIPPAGPRAASDSAKLVTIRTDGWGPMFDGNFTVDVYTKRKIKNQSTKDVQVINNKIYFDLPITATEDDSYVMFKGQKYQLSTLKDQSFIRKYNSTTNAVERDYIIEFSE